MSGTIWRKLWILPPLVLGGGFLAYQMATKPPPDRQPPQERARTVRVIEVTPSRFVPRVLGYGTVSPARTWSAVAQVSGRVVHVHPDFKKGALLKKGTEIVRISPRDYEIAIKRAKANIAAAEARLKELKVEAQSARLSLEIERKALQIKQTELDRKRKLVERGSIAQAVVDQEERDLLNQKARVQDLENTLRRIPAQRAAQQQQIAVYEGELETAELNLERTRVTLPFNARIAEVGVEVTQYVGVGTRLGTADDIATAEIDAQVPQSRFRAFIETVVPERMTRPVMEQSVISDVLRKLGLEAKVHLSFEDRTVSWPARVVRISDTVDPETRTIGAIIAVDDPYGQAIPGKRPPLMKGFFVQVALTGPARADRIVIPRAALHEGRVYVADAEDRLDIREVTAGVQQADEVVIEDGLKAGERVVVSDLSPAIEDMLLEVQVDQELARRLRESVVRKGATR